MYWEALGRPISIDDLLISGRPFNLPFGTERRLGYLGSRRWPRRTTNIRLDQDFNTIFLRFDSIIVDSLMPGNVQIVAPYTSANGTNVDLRDFVQNASASGDGTPSITVRWGTTPLGFSGRLTNQSGVTISNITSGTDLTITTSNATLRFATRLEIRPL